MARMTYVEGFCRDAVKLYRVTEGATIPAGVTVRGRHGAPAVPVDPGDELSRLRAPVREMEAKVRTLATERDILRAAAKYFAAETTW